MTSANVAALPVSSYDHVLCQELDQLQWFLNKSGPILGIGPGSIHIIGPGPMCHMGLAYNRQVCIPQVPTNQIPGIRETR